jgi:hypothetical protein
MCRGSQWCPAAIEVRSREDAYEANNISLHRTVIGSGISKPQPAHPGLTVQPHFLILTYENAVSARKCGRMPATREKQFLFRWLMLTLVVSHGRTLLAMIAFSTPVR